MIFPILPLDPNRKPEQKTAFIYLCSTCKAEVAFLSRLPPWLAKHLNVSGGPSCGGSLDLIREEPRR